MSPLIRIVLPMPATLHEVVATLRAMAKYRITYHFDDPAVECLATPFEGRRFPPPLTVEEAEYVQEIVNRMRMLCDAKGIDIFEMLMAAEAEIDNTWVENHRFTTPEVKELFA